MAIFRPTYALKKITDITPSALKKRGIKALVLDVDNTLTTHNNPAPACLLYTSDAADER